MKQEKKFLITLKAYHFSKKQNKKKKIGKILTRETKPELATQSTKQKKSKLKLEQEFMNDIISDNNN